jgi:hypothetical protein
MLPQQGLGRTHGARRRPASRRHLHRACDKPVEWTPQEVKALRWMVTLSHPGGLGRRSTLSGAGRTRRCGLRSQPDWLRRGRAQRVVGDSRRGASQCRDAHPQKPVSRSRRVAGLENIGCCAEGAIRSEDVARLLAERKPIRMVPDPPSAIELDSEWRDRAGLNGRGPLEPAT